MTVPQSSDAPVFLTIGLNPDWASALSYDFLDHPDGHKPIFVGRQHLLDPLVADIKNPEKTGAYLISGYRGSGKTTLLIEALHRAQQGGASSARKQFVVVLNVSEVSASLESSVDKSAEPITIDPRRLLIALLRSLTNRIRAYEAIKGNKALSQQLKTRISETYDKAIATVYTQASGAKREQEESRSSKSSLELSATMPYKLGGTLAALGALAIEAVAWSDVRVGVTHALAGLAAATAAWSWTKSRSLSKSLKNTRSTETTLKFDNSLQQLENDLKDILQLLYKESMRTIIVLEELDKIDDAGGAQLDKVIRYFKNLFTQAPALFFFLADKAYFDLVESRIRKARSRRYYALEHTFFTHRLYVGRPSLHDSLEYLREAITSDNYRTVVNLYSGGNPASTDDGKRFGKFVRTLVFRSANHLFDLKNELRRYVRNVGSSGDVALIVNDQSFPDDEAALSVFQDLVESKIRAYAFGRERTYANEALQDYLYGVFQEIASTRPQYVMSFYPQPSQEVETAPAEGGAAQQTTRVDSPLEWDEIQRITDAVDSLITDLARGGALQSIDRTSFLWRRNPARAFHLERQLEKHELELLHEVRRLIGELERADASMGIGELIPATKGLLAELREKERTLQLPETSIPLEQANAEREQLRSWFDQYMADLFRMHFDRVRQQYFLDFEQLVYGPGAEGIYRLRLQFQPPLSGSMAMDASDCEVLVVMGSLQQFGVTPIPSNPSLRRASIVQVVLSTTDAIQESASDVWKALHQPMPSQTDAHGNIVPPPKVTVSLDIVELDEGLSKRANPDWGTWGRLLGDTILFRAYWAGRWAGQLFENARVRVSRVEDTTESKVTRSTLLEAVEKWARETPSGEDGWEHHSRLLWVVPPPSGDADKEKRQVPARSDMERQEELQLLYETLWNIFGQPSFVDVAPGHANVLRVEGIAKAVSHVVQAAPISIDVTRRLVQSARLVCLALATPADEGSAAREIRESVGAQGRAVYLGESLPEELRRLGVTRLELP